MTNNVHVFTGIFSDEIGQRFIILGHKVLENAYYALCEQCVPHNLTRLQECLLKVENWDKSVIKSECEKIMNLFPDYEDLFKNVYF